MRSMAIAVVLGLAISGIAADDKGTSVVIDGLKSTTPASWKEKEVASKMRFKQFELAPAEGDREAPELVIFFFGAGSGGGVADNIKRWKGQFEAPAGKSIDDVAKVEEMKVGNVPVTYLDMTGTYLFSAQPGNPNAPKTKKPNFRMLGVVFESPNGPYFMRVTGPATSVEKHKKGFDEWLKAFK